MNLEPTDYEYAGLFVTVTAPGYMHLSHSNAKKSWDRSSSKKAHKHLIDVWARARSALSHRKIKVFGFRCAEPHKDGTPHHHLLIYARPEEIGTVQEQVKRCALTAAPDEPGAQKHRAKFMRFNPQEGWAVGYVAKYVAKNIDGRALDETVTLDSKLNPEEMGDPEMCSERITAWARTNDIRQFQFFGLVPVGIWREIRRIRTPQTCKPLEEVRIAVDRGEYGDYLKKVERSPVELARRKQPRLNRYREIAPDQVLGVRCAGQLVVTRPHSYVIRRKFPGQETANHAAVRNSAAGAPSAPLDLCQ